MDGKRYLGRLGRSECSIWRTYHDEHHWCIYVEAGTNGWTVKTPKETKRVDSSSSVLHNWNEARSWAIDNYGRLEDDPNESLSRRYEFYSQLDAIRK